MKLRVVALLILFLTTTVGWGQTFRGAIQGNVTDSQGAAITGAQVTVTNTATGLARNAVTDSSGNYLVSELPLGEYTVAATKEGFAKKVVTGIRVDVAAREHVDVSLAPGQVKEVVEVHEEQPLIETATNNMGGVIEAQQVSELPINGRDFTKVLVMVPGATGDASGGADSPGSFGLFSANGSRGRSNNYLLDGTDMNDGYRNLPAINQGGVFGTPATILPVDALAEIPVISSGEAEYGRNGGAIVNMVTKSGGNTLHGSIYEYFRNNALDARNYFNFAVDPNSGAPLPQNEFRNNQFGGSIGGPIIKDKTFFFASYEGQRERVGIPFQNTLPTQQMISNFVGGGGTVNPIICNLLQLGGGCTTPNTSFSPWGQALPATGDPVAGAVVQQSIHASNRLDSMIFKIDQHIGKNDVLTGRYFFGDSDQSFPLALLGGGTVPGYNTLTPTRVQILSLSYTHVVSPKLLWEFRGGWNRFNESFFPQDNTFNPASIGLNNLGPNNAPLPTQDLGLPLFSISGFAPIGANESVPRGRIDTNWQLFTNASYTTGKHNLKFGYEFRRTFVNGFFDRSNRGRLNFANFDDFLAGNVSGGHELAGDSGRYTYQNNHAFYAQDNWRLTPKFTLNLGLRWDYFGVIGEKNGLFSLFDPSMQAAPEGMCTDPVCPVARPVKQLYPKDFNNFSPRISMAWDLFGSGKTVVRAGYGIYYDAFSQDFFVGQLPWPTFNTGPAYNYFSATDPRSIYLSYSPNAALGVTACGPNTIVIPNSGGQCAGASFLFDPAFGNDTFTVSQDVRTPYMQNWNLNVQQALGKKVSLQIGYVGSKGTKLFQYVDANQANPATQVQPYPNATGLTYVLQFGSFASSVYNSLQAQLNFRNFHGFTSSLNYTYSHSIDTASDGQDYIPNATQPDNSFNPRAERANSNFDQRHHLVWNYTYELPIKSENMKWLTNGWVIDGVLSLASGMPYNVNWLGNFGFNFNGTGEFYGRPDLVGNPYAGTGGLNLLNLSALQVPCNYDPAGSGGVGNVLYGCSDVSPGNHMGTLPRNAFVGPSFRNFDFSLVKNTSLGERLKMQIRADFFNIFNHPNFGNPIWPGFEVDMLQNPLDATGHGTGFLRPTVTPDVGLGNPYLGGGGPRNIQLAVKFTF
ncbi:MAG: TonB-dependent receptor [Acidobacteriia bacterium]|nr:TonB-dependent receptor [Terriglobia bacterium]